MTTSSVVRRLYFTVVCLVVPLVVLAQTPPEMGWLGVSIAEVNEELADRMHRIIKIDDGRIVG